MIELLGGGRFFWASDYPHPGHTLDNLPALETLADRLTGSAREGRIAGNVREAYGIGQQIEIGWRKP